MAVKPLAILDRIFPNCITITWDLLTFTGLDTGTPAEYPNFNDKTVQVVGTLGTLGSINITGSNDGVNYKVLTDPQGNALTFTAVNMIETISECPRYIRPEVTAGDGTTSFKVIIQATKGTR